MIMLIMYLGCIYLVVDCWLERLSPAGKLWPCPSQSTSMSFRVLVASWRIQNYKHTTTDFSKASLAGLTHSYVWSTHYIIF